MDFNFKQWLSLQEVGTSTSCVAVFQRMVMPMVRRIPPTLLNDDDKEDPFFKKKKKKSDKS